jgi:hypothetical protein
VDTVRLFTLSPYFGTLTSRWVVPLSDPRLTPEALTALDLRCLQVRSSTIRREVSLPNQMIGALPHERPPQRSACEQSRQEPAISSLDWTFTPIPRSTEGFAHHKPVGPPPHFRRASSCPGIDRLASGLPQVTPGEHTALLVNCELVAFATAPALDALTSPLDRTPWPVFQNVPGHTAPRACARFVAFMRTSTCSCMVSGSLHFPSRVLCSVLSRYYCTIGLRTCLGFEDGAPEIRARFPTHATLLTGNLPRTCPYRTITLCGAAFQQTSGSCGRKYPGAKLHISTGLLQRIRIALCRFRSPLLTASRLISFPLPTKMRQFGRLPFPKGISRET